MSPKNNDTLPTSNENTPEDLTKLTHKVIAEIHRFLQENGAIAAINKAITTKDTTDKLNAKSKLLIAQETPSLGDDTRKKLIGYNYINSIIDKNLR